MYNLFFNTIITKLTITFNENTGDYNFPFDFCSVSTFKIRLRLLFKWVIIAYLAPGASADEMASVIAWCWSTVVLAKLFFVICTKIGIPFTTISIRLQRVWLWWQAANCLMVLNIRSNMIFSLGNQVFYLLLDLLKFMTISIICIGSCHSCHFRL